MEDLTLKIKDQAQIKEQMSRIVTAVINGEVDALQVYSQTKQAEQIIGDLNKQIYGHAKDAADEYTEKTITAFGCEIQKKSGSMRPEFKEDEVYRKLEEQLKERKLLLTTALKSKDDIFDSEGVIVPKVSVKYTADSLTIKAMKS